MKIVLFLLTGLLTLSSCSSPEKEVSATVAIRFSHNWENTPVTSTDFNTVKFTNENGEIKLFVDKANNSANEKFTTVGIAPSGEQCS